MGNQSALESKRDGADELEQQIGFNYTINHPVLERTQFICEDQFMISNNQGLMPTKMKTKLSMLTYAEVEQWERKRDKVKYIKNEYLLFPLQAITAGQTTFGYYKELQLVFQCFPYVLMDQIIMRKKFNNHFQQNQIWYTLWTLIDSASTLMNNNLPVGDIRPHNILFNETGDIKIINQLSWPKEQSNYEKLLKGRMKTYVSPEQIQLIDRGMEVDTSEFSHSQSFSIGLTILSLLFLQDGSKLYNLTGQNRVHIEFDQSTFQLIIRNMGLLKYHNSKLHKQVNYSYSLLKIVEGLCSLRSNTRHSITTIWQILKPYSHQIINFQSFQLPNSSSYFHNLPKAHSTSRNIPIPNHIHHILPTVRQGPIPVSIPVKEVGRIRQILMPHTQQLIQVKPYVMPNNLIYAKTLNPAMFANVAPFNVEHDSFVKSLNYKQKDGHKINVMSNYSLNSQSIYGQLQPSQETKSKSHKQGQKIVNIGEESSKMGKKIYRSSTLQKSNKKSPIQSLDSSRYDLQHRPQLDPNKTNLIVSKWVNDQEGSKSPYSSITLQKVISTQDGITSLKSRHFLEVNDKSENKREVKIKQDEQLLAMVEKQLLKSKSLFPSQK